MFRRCIGYVLPSSRPAPYPRPYHARVGTVIEALTCLGRHRHRSFNVLRPAPYPGTYHARVGTVIEALTCLGRYRTLEPTMYRSFNVFRPAPYPGTYHARVGTVIEALTCLGRHRHRSFNVLRPTPYPRTYYARVGTVTYPRTYHLTGRHHQLEPTIPTMLRSVPLRVLHDLSMTCSYANPGIQSSCFYILGLLCPASSFIITLYMLLEYCSAFENDSHICLSCTLAS